MKSGRSLFSIIFSFLGMLLVLFLVMPLLATLLSTDISDFFLSFTDPEVVRSIILTFSAAAIATSIALATGVPLAYLLARRKIKAGNFLEAFINLPIIIPHTAAGVALLLVFGRRGLLGQWLTPYGITFTDNLAGVVIAMLFVSFPYLVTMSKEAFSLVDEEYERVALTDGASIFQAFFHVTLPLAWRGVMGGAVMMWARGISEFGAVVILAYHPKIAPVLVYERFQGFGLKAAQPIALLLILIALLVFSLIKGVFAPRQLDS
jgi:molybdate/tungstate transport system permease protein